mgnify:CR=1 FL=1
MIVFQERGITHLDLHGERHSDVDSIILDFVYQYQDQIPLMIISVSYTHLRAHET